MTAFCTIVVLYRQNLSKAHMIEQTLQISSVIVLATIMSPGTHFTIMTHTHMGSENTADQLQRALEMWLVTQ